MTAERPRIVMIGAFPPPIHGMAVVNKAVLDHLKSAGASPLVIDLAASDLDRRLLMPLSRLPKVFRAIVRFTSMRNLRGAKLYMSVSGGLGQIYEIFFAWLARIKGMRLILHHHSFAYLNIRSFYTQVLINAAGSSSLHIALSERMAELLIHIYKAPQTVMLSNAVFRVGKDVSVNKSCPELLTIGFLSNISAEKGIFEFLDLVNAIEVGNLPLHAQIAGPFQDSRVEQAVNMRLAQMQKVDYVGPKYGADKDEFLNQIDLLVFPTRYVNEAEPMIILEAMSFGVPIIANGRGCIPEIIGTDCGKVVDTVEDFVPTALEQIKSWLGNPKDFEEASQASSRRFLEIYIQGHRQWLELLKNLLSVSIDATNSN